MTQYPIEIKFVINGEAHAIHARQTISFQELMELGTEAKLKLAQLTDIDPWFAVLYVRPLLLIRYFTDIGESDEDYNLDDLVYGSNLYTQLESVINEPQLSDIFLSIDRIVSEMLKVSSIDKLINKVTEVLDGWDKSIDKKKLGGLISKLSMLKLDNETLIAEIVKHVGR